MSETSSPTPGRRPRGRSPAYPAISLEKAVPRLRSLWSRDKNYAVPVATVAKMWGYANLNGPAALTVSALIKFGLVDDAGSKEDRTIAVNDLGVRILNHPSSDARLEAIKEAALTPGIHREMWDQYGASLPSDANLEWTLVRERAFTETGAREFIREYRETIAFAKLGEDDASEAHFTDSTSEDNDLEPDVIEDGVTPELEFAQPRYRFPEREAAQIAAMHSQQRLPLPPARKLVNIPMPDGDTIALEGAFPISESYWDYFELVLKAMKAGLVEPAPAESAHQIAETIESVETDAGS